MTIRVRFFASLADRTGCATESIETGQAGDVAALWLLLLDRHPCLDGLGFRPLVACDMVYADWEQSLEGVDEVAFLPPVSGG